MKTVTLSKTEVLQKLQSDGTFYLAIDPDDGRVVIVTSTSPISETGLQGHEDIFPLVMVTDRVDGFLPGGDWTAASIPNSGAREHDGAYRSYWVVWLDAPNWPRTVRWSPRYEHALRLAGRAHREQLRKGTDIPYLTHVSAVGMILLDAGYSETVVVAGLLHDCAEDSGVSFDEIERQFGFEVAQIVEYLTERDKSQPWEERKRHSIEALRRAPEELKAVAAADKLHNVLSILADYQQIGERVWERFKRGKQDQIAYYTAVSESLNEEWKDQAKNPLFHQLAAAVEELSRLK